MQSEADDLDKPTSLELALGVGGQAPETDEVLPRWGTPVERERLNRIQLSLFAYAYEIESNPLISDADFDEKARAIQPSMSTENELLDKFFLEEFDPCTGQWIHSHPQLDRVAALYRRVLPYYEEHLNGSNDNPV